LSLRVPAQMGRRETKHKGENSKGKLRPRVVLRPGWMCFESHLEGGVNRAKLKFTKLITTTSRVSVRNIIKSAREGAKQIVSE
jgi:hypothetical protein